MHAVLGLLEGNAGFAFEHVFGHFNAIGQVRVLRGDFLAHLGFAVVVSRQAVHELDLRVLGGGHQRGIHLVRLQQADTFSPDFGRFAHRDPDVGVDEVGAFDRFGSIFGQGDAGTGAGSDFTAFGDQFVGRPQVFRGADAHVHAQLAADHQQGVTHIVAGVAQVGVADLRDGLVAVFPHGQHVGQHLGGVPFVG